jgi:hypothetical protein
VVGDRVSAASARAILPFGSNCHAGICLNGAQLKSAPRSAGPSSRPAGITTASSNVRSTWPGAQAREEHETERLAEAESCAR